MEITFYPYSFDYKLQDNKVLVYLYSKLEDGTKICVIHEHQPFFFADPKNIPSSSIRDIIIPGRHQPAKITNIEETEEELLGKTQRFLKIYVNYPKAVPIIAKELEARGMQCYERDVLFIHRYLRDVNITPMTLVKAEGEFKETSSLRVPEFHATAIQDAGKDALQQWKTLAIDIETYAKDREINFEKNPILMIAFYGINEKNETFKKVITWKKFSHKLEYLEFVSDEIDLLKRCKEIILQYQPDILTGYFSDGFDLPYILARAKKHKVKFDIGTDYSEPTIRAKSGFRSSEVKIKGTLHLDIFKFIKYILGMNLKTDSYSLDSVAEELLGHNKHDVNLDELAHIWDNEPEKLHDFCEYNLHDSHLTHTLAVKLLPDIIEFTKIVGVPSYDIIHMRFSKLVENYIMKRAMEFNVLAPNKASGQQMERRMREHIQGAFVYEPTPNLYKDVIVFDFRSLYPTIITAHNIGPESFQCDCCKDKERVPERENYWFCREEKKFLPSVLERLILRRVDLKRLIKEQKTKGEDTKILEARSYALKILANSFYGYLGFFGARWYCLECAASTTAYARNYIHTTIQKAEQKGFQVIYADTDSCFLLLGEKHLTEAMEFMNEVNFELPGHMELEFEGHFPRGIFVAVKGTDKGAKKKYALINEHGGLKITGFEFVRRNWSPLAKETQKHVLELVLSDQKEEAIEYVKEKISELQSKKISNSKLVMKTQITRDLSQYTSIGPHVLVARKMEMQGHKITPGTMVEYIIAEGSGLVRERAAIPDDVPPGEYDADYYLNHQLLPAVSSIFAVLGYSDEELLGKGKQTGLGQFM